MSAPVIQVENLGKKYTIGHKSSENGRYVALRDVVAQNARYLWDTTRDLVLGRPIILGDTQEEVWALKDVSFEVKKGEVLGIIGRNGAGKSTLLKILSRITEPTAGRLRIRGRVASLLEVGTGFHPELTGRENIFLNGAVLGMTRAEIKKKFAEIVAFAEVEKFIDTPVKRYSSGMYVRLAFAVAAHLEPEVLLVDEVLAVGDAEFQKKCLGKMGEVARGGRTVLFVSHNMNAVERLCDRVAVLERGTMAILCGDVRKAIQQYLGSSYRPLDNVVWENRRGELDNEYFVPERLEVSSAALDSLPGEPFSNAYPIDVYVTGVVPTLDAAMNVGVGVYSDHGDLLFWSFTTDEVEERWPRIAIGRTRLRVRLPARLLNEGTYRVELLASLHNRAWLLEPRATAPSLVFSIRGGLSDSPLWDGKRPGILAPVLRWEAV